MGFDREYRVVRGVRIPIGGDAGGIELAADLFLPVRGPVPALVTMSPYRKDALGGVGAADTVRWFASHGYAGVLVDLRGTGSSGGVAHPPFDPAEADDGAAVVEWAAAQPWCTGAVGMWGFSYSAALALRTASRKPPHLKAVIPVMGFADPARDFIHPGGGPGAIAPLGIWTLGTVLDLLLPPLDNHADPAEQRRWRRRVDHADPYLVDLRRHGPDHEVWRSRVTDLAAVTVPALCVGGWRDVFGAGAVRAYEGLGGPKKLLMGPWLHSMPDDAPVAPVDFCRLALRWWDRWLAGADNGVDREPPVTLYVQGSEPGWRHYGSWPPPAKSESSGFEVGDPVPADPTVGALSGLWGIPTGSYGWPLDQHGDDLASLTATGRPLERPLLIIGRPVLTAGGTGRRRHVVRLADVDPAGRSTMITGAVVAPGAGPEIELDPTCYRVPAGHRLRITLSGGAFPRLWPSAGPDLRADRLSLTLPVTAAAEGEPASLPPPTDPRGGLWLHNQPKWEIRRDVLQHGTTVIMGGTARCHDPTRAHLIELDSELRAGVRRDAPDQATVLGRSTTTVHRGTGERVEVRIDLHCTENATSVVGTVRIDGVVVAERDWRV